MLEVESGRLTRHAYYLEDGFYGIEEIDEKMGKYKEKIEFDSINYQEYEELLQILFDRLASEFGYHRIEERPEFRYYAVILTRALPGDFDASNYDLRTIDDFEPNIDVMDLNFIEFINWTYGMRNDEDLDANYQFRIEEFNKADIGYSHRPLYPFLKSWTYSFSPLRDHLRVALETGYKAIETLNDPNVHEHFANVVARTYEKYDSIEFEVDGKKINKEESIQSAINKLTNYEDSPRSFDVVLSRLYALRGDFDQAETHIIAGIEKGTSVVSRSEKAVNERNLLNKINEQRRLGEIQEKIDTVDEQLDTIKKKQELVDENLEDAISEYDHLEEKTENLTDRFQRQFAQFIGFFSGIIVIAVSSANIVSNVGSLNTAGRLILMMSGGIVLSFSSLHMFIYEDIDKNYLARTGGAILIGIILLLIPILFL